MASILRRVRSRTIAVLCTVVLFAIAAWVPNNLVDMAAWLTAMFLGLPVAILANRAAVGNAVLPRAGGSAKLVLAQRLFGALSLLIGVGAAGWLAYHNTANQASGFMGPTLVAQGVLTVALCGLGYLLLRPPPDVNSTTPDP